MSKIIAVQEPGESKEPTALRVTARDTRNSSISTESDTMFVENSNTLYPVLKASTSDGKLTVSWEAPFAKSFSLFYAPVDLSSINSIDLQQQKIVTVDVSIVPPLYIAIEACYEDGTCEVSNVLRVP